MSFGSRPREYASCASPCHRTTARHRSTATQGEGNRGATRRLLCAGPDRSEGPALRQAAARPRYGSDQNRAAGWRSVRRLGPFAHDRPHLEGSLRFAYLNAGKKSLTLDLVHPEGRALLLRLVEQADVLLESFAPGELDRLGLGPDVLRARNPRLVITSVTGFGQSGPYRDYLCPDLVAFAMGGLMYISGDPALPPVKAPQTQAFYYASVCAALGTLLALWHRAQGGEGCAVDVAAQEAIATHEHLIRAFGFDGHSIQIGR